MPEQTLAQRIKAKYPGSYDDVPDAELEARVLKKYPGTYDQLPRTNTASTSPPEWAVQPMRESTPADLIDPGDRVTGASALSQWAHVKRHPIETAATFAIPGILGAAGKYGPPAVRGAAAAITKFLSTPAGGATTGAAYEGVRTKGDLRSMAYGAAAGAGMSTLGGDFLSRLKIGRGVDPVAAGMSQAATKPVDPRFDFDHVLAAAEARLAAKAAAPTAAQPSAPQATTPQQALRQEIDWRTTDAVPIDAMKRKGILEAGESRVGLSERMAQLMKQGTPEAMKEAELLAKALRQRMHIGGR